MNDKEQSEKKRIAEEQSDQLWNMIRELAKEYSTLTPEEKEKRRLETLKEYPFGVTPYPEKPDE